MPAITINVDDKDWPELVEAFAATYGYVEQVPNPEPQSPQQSPNEGVEGHADERPEWQTHVPNPEAKEDFVRRLIANYVSDVLVGFRAREAQAAAAAASAAAEAPSITVA